MLYLVDLTGHLGWCLPPLIPTAHLYTSRPNSCPAYQGGRSTSELMTFSQWVKCLPMCYQAGLPLQARNQETKDHPDPFGEADT